ncbi:Non-canonical non-ribosomal peptide synthetase FUB8 [Frankliniella fusca]|uniref:Non-canonical non-ribosomal peptide synthetase FUB8 n=1 Tax=Frankliniella fusca TaxID=407009 RepID=A0AAE1H5B5_9NEOP|nr:Non-canonical non-ribosomal peptide synthetase FUB8 [Frankliniella fusca]
MLLVFDVFFQAPLLCSLEGLQFYLPIAEAFAKGLLLGALQNWFSIDRDVQHVLKRFNRFDKAGDLLSIELRSVLIILSSVEARLSWASHSNLLSYSWTFAAAPETSSICDS